MNNNKWCEIPVSKKEIEQLKIKFNNHIGYNMYYKDISLIGRIKRIFNGLFSSIGGYIRKLYNRISNKEKEQ